MASKVSIQNDYAVPQHRRRLRSAQHNLPRRDKVPLCLPSISDTVTSAIQRSIARTQLENDAVLVSIPDDSINRQLVRNSLYDRECISASLLYPPTIR